MVGAVFVCCKHLFSLAEFFLGFKIESKVLLGLRRGKLPLKLVLML